MSLDIGDRLKVFFASAPQTIHKVDVLEISHSLMTKTYHLWREPFAGSYIDENFGAHDLEPCNFTVKPAGSEQNLDQKYEIRLDTIDIEDEFRLQMDRVPIDTQEFVKCIFREYLSDDMNDPLSVVELQMENVSYKLGAATITAVTPRLNTSRTGEIYAPRDVPMLRNFL